MSLKSLKRYRYQVAAKDFSMAGIKLVAWCENASEIKRCHVGHETCAACSAFNLFVVRMKKCGYLITKPETSGSWWLYHVVSIIVACICWKHSGYLLYMMTWWYSIMDMLSELLTLWKGTYYFLVDSRHKGPVIWTLFLCFNLNNLLTP